MHRLSAWLFCGLRRHATVLLLLLLLLLLLRGRRLTRMTSTSCCCSCCCCCSSSAACCSCGYRGCKLNVHLQQRVVQPLHIPPTQSNLPPSRLCPCLLCCWIVWRRIAASFNQLYRCE